MRNSLESFESSKPEEFNVFLREQPAASDDVERSLEDGAAGRLATEAGCFLAVGARVKP